MNGREALHTLYMIIRGSSLNHLADRASIASSLYSAAFVSA